MKGKYENTNPLEKLHAGEPDLPPGLPPVPVQREILTWAFDQFGDADFDKLSDKRMFDKLESWLMGLEAVREPATEMKPTPDATNEARI